MRTWYVVCNDYSLEELSESPTLSEDYGIVESDMGTEVYNEYNELEYLHAVEGFDPLDFNPWEGC